ncbi:hypothetical protein EXS62_02150 [Candidatus Kaiserbacteria bacterium]|nr:hypothetical protein [Candidatus Kaiserbacteria bacterium]
MARLELPESRLRARKRRHRLRIGIVLGVFVLLLSGGLIGAAYIPAVRISAVSVTGAQTIPPGTIETQVREHLAGKYLWVLPKDTIFIYPKVRIADDLLAAYPSLASVDVHAVDFHTVGVAVVERVPRALWCTSSEAPSAECYFMDENGVVYAPAPVFSSPVYSVYAGALENGMITDGLPKQFLGPGQFSALSALVDAIGQKVPNDSVRGTDINRDGDVIVRFESNFLLEFALADEGGDLFERFTLALTSAPFKDRALGDFQYLDLRFGDKLYYKERQ